MRSSMPLIVTRAVQARRAYPWSDPVAKWPAKIAWQVSEKSIAQKSPAQPQTAQCREHDTTAQYPSKNQQNSMLAAAHFVDVAAGKGVEPGANKLSASQDFVPRIGGGRDTRLRITRIEGADPRRHRRQIACQFSVCPTLQQEAVFCVGCERAVLDHFPRLVFAPAARHRHRIRLPNRAKIVVRCSQKVGLEALIHCHIDERDQHGHRTREQQRVSGGVNETFAAEQSVRRGSYSLPPGRSGSSPTRRRGRSSSGVG